MRIGFIGVGRMGSAIAGRLRDAGMEIVVYDSSPGMTAPFAAAGVAVAGDLRECCGDRDIVITMLPDDTALEDVTLGAGGICHCLPAGSVHMMMGTHGPAAVGACAGRHEDCGQVGIATPVLGRPDVAAAGQLGLIIGGTAAAAQRCKPVIDVVARRVFVAGDKPEYAAVAKLANSLVLACAIEAMGEGFSLVRKYGVDAKVLYDVMTEGLFAAPAYKGYGKLIAEEDYATVGFTVALGLKEVRLILSAADRQHVPLPAAHVLHDRLLSLVANEGGGKDWACIAREQAKAAGLP
ncbi:MAG: NAD(P)-dependent oxidoreductase [Bradyrhizobiaceae bacterium]|nr:NAD(P)-dependent oxidoreductase [Bradyrhizobiaceae bacterium]